MTAADWLQVFEAAKAGARYLRDEDERLRNVVTDMLPALSRLIHKIEGLLK